MMTNSGSATPVEPFDTQTAATIDKEFNILANVGQGNNFAATGYVRFMLAVIILIFHSYSFTKFSVPFEQLLPEGGSAVCAFFLLSGWVIGSTLERSPHGFYKRRAERLLPVYLVCLAWAQVPWAMFGHTILIPGRQEPLVGPTSAWILIAHLFFLQNFVGAIEADYTPAWTLSCEVFCYALAPLFHNTRTKWLFALAGMSLAFYLVKGLFKLPLIPSGTFLETAFMTWAWLAGFIAFRLRQKMPLVSVILLCSLGTFCLPSAGYIVLLTAASLLFGHLLTLPKILDKIGIILGDLSYPLYLSHAATLTIFSKLLPEAFKGRTTVALLGALAFAMIILFAVDVPSQSFFKRGRFKRAAQLAS
jgi:peptidoglycan/LPS O-acetylase OafA/YrhL